MKALAQCCTAAVAVAVAVAELHNTYSKDAQGRSSNRFPFFRVSLGSTLPLPLPLLWYLALIDLTAEDVAALIRVVYVASLLAWALLNELIESRHNLICTFRFCSP